MYNVYFLDIIRAERLLVMGILFLIKYIFVFLDLSLITDLFLLHLLPLRIHFTHLIKDFLVVVLVLLELAIGLIQHLL